MRVGIFSTECCNHDPPNLQLLSQLAELFAHVFFLYCVIYTYYIISASTILLPLKAQVFEQTFSLDMDVIMLLVICRHARYKLQEWNSVYSDSKEVFYACKYSGRSPSIVDSFWDKVKCPV